MDEADNDIANAIAVDSKFSEMDIKLIDGGFSTQMSYYVGEIDGDPLWTARYLSTDPKAVLRTHLDYLRAGAQYIETCTYQASVPNLMKYLGITDKEAEELIREAAKLAFQAVDKYVIENPESQAQVVGSIGPYGALLHDASEFTGSYMDTVSEETIKDTHRPRIAELIRSGVTLFAFETIPSKKEGEIFVELLKEFPRVKAWLSFVCKDEKSLVNGDDFKETAIHCYNLNPKQIMAVGINCTNPVYVTGLLQGINLNRTKEDFIPLIAYPNSGEDYTMEIGWLGRRTLDPIYTFVREWYKLGVRYVGGCCRIRAKDIELIKEEIKSWDNKTDDPFSILF